MRSGVQSFHSSRPCAAKCFVDVLGIIFFHLLHSDTATSETWVRRLSATPKKDWYMNAEFSTYIPRPALSFIGLRSVVDVGLGQVLLQEFQVLLGSTSDTLLSGSGSGDIGSGRRRCQDGLSGVELGELGGEVRGQSGCLRSGRGGV